MGTTTEKLNYLKNTKEKIAEVIKKKGGTVTEDTTFREYADAIKNIPSYPEPTGSITINANGSHNVKDKATAVVNVPNTYTASDEGKVVSNGTLVPQSSQGITENGTYDTTLKSQVVVNVEGTKNILSGNDVPTASVGSDGDIYLFASSMLIPTKAAYDSHIIAGQNQSSGSYPAYKAYDGNDNTFWSTRDGNYNAMWIGYDFGIGNEVIVNSVDIMPRSWNGVVQIHTFKVQASNDLETWVDLYEGEIPNNASKYAGVWNKFLFTNNTEYRAYRILALDINESKTFTIFGLQFIGMGRTITSAFCKVNGAWQDLIGTDIYDVNTGE